MDDQGSNSRRVRNLQDLLQVSVANSQPNAVAEAENDAVPSRSEEERQWLADAFKNLGIDVAQELMKAIKIVEEENQKTNSNAESIECALDYIMDFIDNGDFARDFMKMGGLRILIPCLESPHESVRFKAADVIAELTQNQNYCQEEVLKSGIMKKITALVEHDFSEKVRVKALYALSCMVRSYDEGEDCFVKNDGFSILMKCLQSSNESLRMKSSFFLSSLCSQKETYKDILYEMGMVDQLVSNLKMPQEPSHEFIASALFSLSSNKSCLNELKKPDLQARLLFEEKINEINGLEEYEEELLYLKNLVTIMHDDTEEVVR